MAAGFAFVVIDKSTAASPLHAAITAQWLSACVAACALQLNRDVSPYWGGAYSGRVGTDAQPGEIVFQIVDALPDAPGAEAYHDETGQDAPDAFLALTTCSTLDDVSSGISHELCEIVGDPGCNRWVDDGANVEHALELCDAVQANVYKEGEITLSDFLLPSYFAGAAAASPYSFCEATIPSFPNRASSPFATTGGGYQLQRVSGAGETQVTGMLGKRAIKAKHWSSRAARRGLKAA